MEAGVQRTDSQKVHANGPRVSFNRDVHVKRIGPRSNENTNYKIETTNLQPPSTQHLRRELPADLSEEGIRKEAALILAQAERIKCKAEGANNIPSQKSNHKRSIPNKFNSLPSRKKKTVDKPVSRSVSDASSKKSKKPSIFSIFSRKSDSNLNQDHHKSRFAESGGRRLVRSKSDAGSYKEPKVSKKRHSEKEESHTGSSKLPSQLSPIIENTQKEEYFEELFNRERRKSEAITAQEKNATDLKVFLAKYNSEPKTSGNIGYTNHKDLDLVPSKPIAETISALHENTSKSVEDMHSSQLPQQKPALTKGLTVNGMVKRLSMERFSPPPTISGPAFSYIRPNEQIIYAQLAPDEDRNMKRHTEFSTRVSHHTTHRNSVDMVDHPSSHNTGSRITIESPSRATISPARDSFSPGPTMIRIQQTRSPWRQLSPRNLSDEDEGLGIEMRKNFEEDVRQRSYDRSKTPPERPIVPVMRSITPPNHRLQQEPADEINALSRRRAVLESRISSRRFTPPETVTIKYHTSPERNRHNEEIHESNHRQYLTPERDEYNRYHKLRSEEIMNKYSPERTHLDMIAPNKGAQNGKHTSRYVHTKYYDDGTGGVKEIYEREARLDDQGKPIVRESRRRERVDSPGRSIENNGTPIDYEPKSLDSQLHYRSDRYRSSPQNLVHVTTVSHTNSLEPENWQDSLKRDQRQQRSFDKGDSGIENDFRKESFNGDISSKWRKRTFHDDVAVCEQFIKKEKRHTEEQHPQRKSYDFIYRERSIDDGSHYDPRLDKYPKSSTSTLRHSGKGNPSPSSTSQSCKEDTLKRNKKVGGFQKVKQLFSGSRKKENEAEIMVNGKIESAMHGGPKDKYMVKEEEMRSRYREHRGSHHNDLREPKMAPDISMRRRLSTPKASPLLKRTSSEATRVRSPLAAKNSVESKPEKSSWFKSIDRRAKSKSKEKLDTTLSGETDSSHTPKRNTYHTPPPPPIPPKTFRFFGDTDLDSNPPTVSRINTTPKSRPSVSTLNRTQKYSQSAYNLDRINQTPQSAASSRLRSNSLQNLEEDGTDEIDTRKRRHYSRSRNLDDISESGSETEDQYKRQPVSGQHRSVSREKLDRPHRYDDRKSSERHLTASTSTLKRTPDHPTAADTNNHTAKPPPKPARNGDRRYHPRNIDRLPDSSGTEGESSMQSQRSVVYLHATTVGAIPQPYQSSSRRRAISREDLRKNKLQPMTKTVSRSVSMLAPWKPKHRSEGYEINYSQEQNGKDKRLLTTLPRKSTPTQTSISTLTRNKKAEPSTRSRRQTPKDDLSSIRNSSSTSAPKSNISSTLDSRKETLRRK